MPAEVERLPPIVNEALRPFLSIYEAGAGMRTVNEVHSRAAGGTDIPPWGVLTSRTPQQCFADDGSLSDCLSTERLPLDLPWALLRTETVQNSCQVGFG